MPARDIIVLGASEGGIAALKRIVKDLSADLPASLFVVVHIPVNLPSNLPMILSRAGPLPASHARDGEPIKTGHIYVAPPDHHLVLQQGFMRLSHGPRENSVRPAVDPLFRSAARYYGDRVIAVLLTGGLNDGVAGLMAVRNAGGLALVQEPGDAVNAAMPRNALTIAGADHVLPVAKIPAALELMVRQPVQRPGASPMTDPIEQMPETVERDMAAQARGARSGAPSVYSCPECGGVLWEEDQGEIVRFRCHVGHAYYGEQLLAEQAEALEAALWVAVRTFRERATLGRQLAAKERARGQADLAARFEDQAILAEQQGEAIQRHLLKRTA